MNSSNEHLNFCEKQSDVLKLNRRRRCLYTLQWFFFSGLATLSPYLYSTHPTELGLSALEKTWIHMFSSIFLSFVCTITIHRNFNKKLLLYFKPLLITFLIVAVLSHIALLFVPRTQRIARYPKITLNCTTSGSSLRIELCQNLIRRESILMNHQSFFDSLSSFQKNYNSFQCDRLLKTSTSTWSSSYLPKLNQNLHQNIESSNKEPNYNNDFTTFSMAKCKGVCLDDFSFKHEPKNDQLFNFFEKNKVRNKRMKTSKNNAGVMDSDYDVFDGRTQICFKKNSESKSCYTPDPDSISSNLNHLQNNDHQYVQNIVSFPALNSTIYHVNQILFHSKIQSWQPIHSYPQLPNQIYPYPSCLFKQSVPVFMDGQSFETIICPNLLEIPVLNKVTSEKTNNLNDNNYEFSDTETIKLSKSKEKNSGFLNCDTVCNTNLIYKGQFSGKYFGHHSMQLPYSPIICHDIIGNPMITFYSYLIIRCIADLSLMICFLVIDSLNIYYAANFDTIYGGLQKAISYGSSTFVWSLTSGFLIDYYSSVLGKPDYSPAFILFAGFFLIACSIVASIQIAPNTNEFKCIKKNHNFSNAFISDLCGSNLNCDKVESLLTINMRNSDSNLRNDKNLLSINSSRNKALFVFILPFILALGLFYSVCQMEMNTYYMSLGSSKLWVGCVICLSFIISTFFILIVKPLISAIGRTNLIALGFIFYSLQFFGNSLLVSNAKWTLIPFNSMIAFSLVLAWIGCTSKLHNLLKLNRLTHLKLQLWVILIKFGYGRILGSVVWFFWFYYFNEINECWLIDYLNITELDSKPINRIEMSEEINAYRILLRFLSIISLFIGFIFFVLYHFFEKCSFKNYNWKKKHLRNRRKITFEINKN